MPREITKTNKHIKTQIEERIRNRRTRTIEQSCVVFTTTAADDYDDGDDH